MPSSRKTIFETITPTGKYSVVDMVYNLRPARVLFASDETAAQSGIATDDQTNLLFEYNQRFLELASGMNAKKILLIGGGVLTLPMALRKELPKAHTTVVEIEPVLTSIAQDYFGYEPSDAVTIINDDGLHFLRTSKHEYDLIIIDAFQDAAIPQSLQTAETVRLIRERLSKKGIVACNVISAYFGRANKIIADLQSTYSDTFETVAIYPASNDLSLWLPLNLLLIASGKSAPHISNHLRFPPLSEQTSSQINLARDLGL